MLGVAASSMVLWLVYGYYERNVPVLFGNAVNLFFTSLLIFFKWRFRERISG